MQKKNKPEVFKKAMLVIKAKKLLFIEEVCVYSGVNKRWFYENFPVGSSEYIDITKELEKNKVNTKIDIRKKWGESNDKTERMALYKVCSTKAEHARLGYNTSAIDESQEEGSTGQLLAQTLQLRDSIIDVHYSFFQKEFDWYIEEGGSRSGKTYNFLKWAYLQTRIRNFSLNIIQPSYKMLEQGMFADAKKIIQEFDPDIKIPERPTHIDLRNGSRWVFEVVTSENEAKRNRDNVVIDEADGIPMEVAMLLGRAHGKKYVLYNPTKKFWAHTKVNEDGSNLLKSTWQQNPYLTQSQLQWFADLKRDGEFAEEGSPERYAYEVYYLGQYSLLSGKAYAIEDFDIVEEVPDSFDFFISYADPSIGDGGDFFAALFIGIKNNIPYAIDCIFSQFVKVGGYVEKLNEWDQFSRNLCDHYAEKNGMSGVVTKAAKNLYDGSIHEVANSDNKRADIIVYSTTAKKYKFKKSQQMLKFLEQCSKYPNDPNDDAPDCLSRSAKIITKFFDI